MTVRWIAGIAFLLCGGGFGLAGTQTAFKMVAGHIYIFKLMWKANKNAAGATIYAAAGPGPFPWSHTRLTVLETN